MHKRRWVSDRDGFDHTNPWKLPSLTDDLEPLDLALVYFTVSTYKTRGSNGGSGGWGAAASASSSQASVQQSNAPNNIVLNLMGAVRLASRVFPNDN